MLDFSMPKPIKLYRLDASAARKSNCKLRLKRIVIEGLKDKVTYSDTLYGSAFHLFVKTMYSTGGDFAQGINVATLKFSEPCEVRSGKKHLTQEHLIKTCVDYWNNFKKTDDFETLMIDGKAAVEQDFDIPYYQEETEDAIYQVNLSGTIDGIGKFPRGCYAFRDYKTHSLWAVSKEGRGESYIQKEIAEYFKDFDLSCQLMFYAVSLLLLAQKNPETELGKLLSQPIASFINGIFLSGTEPTRFARSQIRIYQKQELQDFQLVINGLAQQLVWLAKNPDYDNRDGIACGACVDDRYDCEFKRLCINHYDKSIRKLLVDQAFIQKQYNPLEFSK